MMAEASWPVARLYHAIFVVQTFDAPTLSAEPSVFNCSWHKSGRQERQHERGNAAGGVDVAAAALEKENIERNIASQIKELNWRHSPARLGASSLAISVE